jgi:hypothetical protein
MLMQQTKSFKMLQKLKNSYFLLHNVYRAVNFSSSQIYLHLFLSRTSNLQRFLFIIEGWWLYVASTKNAAFDVGLVQFEWKQRMLKFHWRIKVSNASLPNFTQSL